MPVPAPTAEAITTVQPRLNSSPFVSMTYTGPPSHVSTIVCHPSVSIWQAAQIISSRFLVLHQGSRKVQRVAKVARQAEAAVIDGVHLHQDLLGLTLQS